MLPALRSLQHLSMHQVVGEGPYASHMTLARSLDSLHTQVPQLTHLELKTGNGCGNECLVLAKLAALTGLRYAALPCTPQLPTAVSKLQLLTHLQLLFERSHAAVEYQLGGLGSLSQLQRLVLLQAKPAGEQIGVGLLLGEVGQLQHLTHLDIYNCSDAAASPTAYSALTASSSLQHLHLGGFCLPKGAWAHMFPGHRQLPALRKISHYQRKSGLYHVGDGLRGTVRMTPAELAGLVSCAPNLQQLNFPCMRVSAAALQPLSELTQLTELVVSTVNDAAAQAIASFPNLSVSKAYGTITVYGLKALIQLTRLTSLKVSDRVAVRCLAWLLLLLLLPCKRPQHNSPCQPDLFCAVL